MSRFLFYIVNLDEGTVQGTNNVEDCESVINDDTFVIIHAQSGVYWLGSRKENNIEQMEPTEDENYEDD